MADLEPRVKQLEEDVAILKGEIKSVPHGGPHLSPVPVQPVHQRTSRTDCDSSSRGRADCTGTQQPAPFAATPFAPQASEPMWQADPFEPVHQSEPPRRLDGRTQVR